MSHMQNSALDTSWSQLWGPLYGSVHKKFVKVIAFTKKKQRMQISFIFSFSFWLLLLLFFIYHRLDKAESGPACWVSDAGRSIMRVCGFLAVWGLKRRVSIGLSLMFHRLEPIDWTGL